MSELTIKSRKTGEVFEFWMDDDGGYIYLQSEDRPGFLGRQICENGSFMGATLDATPETFCAVCRRWYRQWLKHHCYYMGIE